jgi:hypothetical protein
LGAKRVLRPDDPSFDVWVDGRMRRHVVDRDLEQVVARLENVRALEKTV